MDQNQLDFEKSLESDSDVTTYEKGEKNLNTSLQNFY